MTRRRFLTLSISCLFSLGLLADQALTQDLKARMAGRLPAVNALKDQGIVGEGADGLLHFVANARQDEATVNAENADRNAVYAAIAKQQGASPAVVGQRRALQLFDIAKAGHWIQPGGQWKKK
jgi:uncharacterized protein YdbL (DUF1318 family)